MYFDNKALLSKIMLYVADFTDISVQEIKGKKRNANIAQARHMFCFLARAFQCTFKEIGEFINKDHTSVIHSVRTIQHEIDVYGHFREIIEHYLMLIKSSIDDGLLKVYIVGAYSKLPQQEAIANFEQAEKLLTDLGYPVVYNPVKLYQPDSTLTQEEEWAQAMETLIPYVCKSDAIYLQSNWELSKGSRIELSIAKSMNKVILYPEGVKNA